MHQAVVRDIQQLDIVPEFQQRCCHNRLHEVVVIDGDCPVFLLCDPHPQLLPLTGVCRDWFAGLYATTGLGIDAIG